MPPVGQAIHQPIRHRTCSQLSYRRSCHRRTNLSAIACPAGLATNELGALRAHASADHVEHTGHVRRGGRDTVPEDAESPFALGGGVKGLSADKASLRDSAPTSQLYRRTCERSPRSPSSPPSLRPQLDHGRTKPCIRMQRHASDWVKRCGHAQLTLCAEVRRRWLRS